MILGSDGFGPLVPVVQVRVVPLNVGHAFPKSAPSFPNGSEDLRVPFMVKFFHCFISGSSVIPQINPAVVVLDSATFLASPVILSFEP